MSAWRPPSLRQNLWLMNYRPHGRVPEGLRAPSPPAPSTGPAEVHGIVRLLRVFRLCDTAVPRDPGFPAPGFHPSILNWHPVNVSAKPVNIFLMTKKNHRLKILSNKTADDVVWATSQRTWNTRPLSEWPYKDRFRRRVGRRQATCQEGEVGWGQCPTAVLGVEPAGVRAWTQFPRGS